MEAIPVFDWARVNVARAFLDALPIEKEKSKHDVIQELALSGGVSLQWDKSGHAHLEGAWSSVLQAQVIFAEYLANLEVVYNPADCTQQKAVIVGSHVQDSTKSNAKNHPKPVNKQKEVDVFDPKTIQVLSADENEVYVNITVSSLPYSGLSAKAGIPKSNTSQEHIPPPLADKTDSDKSESRSNVEAIDKDKHSALSDCIKDEYSSVRSNAEINELKGILGSQKCVSVKKGNTGETECRLNKNHYNQVVIQSLSSRERDIIEKEKEISQYLKIPCKVQVITSESKNSIKEDDGFDLSTSHRDKHNMEQIKVFSSNLNMDSQCVVSAHLSEKKTAECTAGTETSSDTVVTNATSFNNGDNKTAKSNNKKKKNYEELTPFKFFCSLCSFKSKRESHYQRHLQLHNQVSQLFACDKCNFTTIRLGHLRRHELSHSSSTLSCNLCRYRTNNHKFLAKHKRIKHNTNQAHDGVKEILHCMHCEYSTSKSHFFQRHLRVHGSNSSSKAQRSYQCEQCSYKTTRREHLVRHTSNVHGGHRPFLCHHCGKAFKRQDALKQHATTHMTQATVMCPMCGKGCRSQAHLTQHLAVHSTVRSFLCELCGSAFKTRAVQRKHVLTIHQHPKAFFCHHCSRKFNTKYALRRHIKQHSTEKKNKSEDRLAGQEVNGPVPMPDVFGNPMRMLQADAIFIQDTTRNHLPDNSTAIAVQGSVVPHEGEKITVQLTESYDPETLRVIPSHSFVQHNNETATALLYLTGSFTPY